jgi:hypothetical protein
MVHIIEGGEGDCLVKESTCVRLELNTGSLDKSIDINTCPKQLERVFDLKLKKGEG